MRLALLQFYDENSTELCSISKVNAFKKSFEFALSLSL